MYHISVNLAIGQRDKYLGIQKAPVGRQKGYKDAPNDSVDLFFQFNKMSQ